MIPGRRIRSIATETACYLWSSTSRRRPMRAYLALSLVALVSTGCSGSVHMDRVSKDSGSGSVQEPVDGVIAYLTAPFIKTTRTSYLVDPKTLLPLGKECTPHDIVSIEMMPDFNNPYRVFYTPGLFETNAFSVSLENGALTGVNTSSTPDRGSTVATVAQGLVALAALAAATGPTGGAEEALPGCNGGESLVSLCSATDPTDCLYAPK